MHASASLLPRPSLHVAAVHRHALNMLMQPAMLHQQRPCSSMAAHAPQRPCSSMAVAHAPGLSGAISSHAPPRPCSSAAAHAPRPCSSAAGHTPRQHSSAIAHAPRQRRSVSAHASFGCSSSVPSVDIEEGKKMLDKGLAKFIDIRPRHEWDEEHLTKPPRCAFSVPFEEQSFVDQIAAQFPNKAAGLLVACTEGGHDSARAVELLAAAGFTGAVQVAGGYSAWTKVFSTSGRRKPPPGRWVSTGKEALKSGLTIPGAAESYEEGGNLKKARYAQGFTSDEGGLP